MIFPFRRRFISSSTPLRFRICIDWTSTEESGGIIMVAKAVLGSVGCSSSGSKSFHLGSSLILFSFSSYLAKPCSERKRDSSISLSGGMLSLSDNSFMLCHDPSLRIAK